MTVAPTKLTFIVGVASIAVIGAVFTLVYRPAVRPVSYNADSSTSADITPTLTSQGVVENPPLSVTVNGRQIPAKPGTTRVDTPGGAAIVQVSGNSATVDTESNQATSSTPQDSLNVSVSSSSNGTTQSDSFTSVNSNSHTTVSGSGSSHVHIETHNSN